MLNTLLEVSASSVNPEVLRSATDQVCEDIVRVLLVEDNPLTQFITIQQLKMLGCSARAASSGAEALAVTSAERMDLILMDCRLPNLNGYETVRAIRAFERCYDRVPATIVAVTGDEDVECVDKCFSAGMDGHVSKPVSIHILRNVIAHFLKSR